MKAICVLLFLALAVFARADDQAMSQEVAAVAEQGVADLAVDFEADEAVDEDESADEDESGAEDESEDESEGEEEDEMSLIEAEAEAQAESEADTEADADRKRKHKKRVRAPKAMKKWKYHAERVPAQTSKNEDPAMAKLDLALAAVKEDILSTNKQITDERKWVIAVAKIIASYNDKMKRVEAHIIALRKEMKSLYRKKKQIENLKLQKALESKLKEARSEHGTLLDSLKHVQTKQTQLNKSGTDLRQTIAGIQGQLAKLRGQQLRKPKAAPRHKCGKGKRYSKTAKKCVARKSRNARKAARKTKKF